MKLNRNNVLATAIGTFISVFLLSFTPNPSNTGMEFRIFLSKYAFVLLMLYICMEKEK